MKESRFRGWKDVFSFTFHQMTKRKGYKAVTALVSVLLFAVTLLVIVITGKPEEKEIKECKIQAVYVTDAYEVQYAPMLSMLGKEAFAKVEFLKAKDCAEAIEFAKKEEKDFAYIVVNARYEDGVFTIEGIVPENSTAEENEAGELLTAMAECFEYAKADMANLSMEQAVAVAMPILTDAGKIGEDHSLGAMLVKTIAPMVFGLILYMMLIFYGQDVSREISIEKVSKLTETLLTSIKPYAMITGKVLAVTLTAIMQFFCWIAFAVFGLIAGNAIAKAMYPGYENAIFKVLDYIRETYSASAFSPTAVLLAVLIFVIGFLFYCVLAGMAGSLVSKPEDLGSVQSIFMFPIILSFFAAYFGALLEKKALIAATRFIPFTIPFGVPVELLTGTAGILQGLISLGILLVFTVLLIILSGRMYEGLILYNGQKMSAKKLVNVIRAKKN